MTKNTKLILIGAACGTVRTSTVVYPFVLATHYVKSYKETKKKSHLILSIVSLLLAPVSIASAIYANRLFEDKITECNNDEISESK